MNSKRDGDVTHGRVEGPCWSALEQNILESTMRKWLDNGGTLDSLRLYALVSRKLETKDIRDVAFRVQWLARKVEPLLDENCGGQRLQKILTSALRNGSSLECISEARSAVTKLMNENDALFAQTQRKIQIQDYVSSKSSLMLLQRNIRLALDEMVIISKNVSHLPRLPVSMNISLATSLGLEDFDY